MRTLEKSDRSAIILADISEGKFSRDKGLLKLDNKPLLDYVIDAVKSIVNEIIVVTASEEQADQYSKVSPPNICFKLRSGEPKGDFKSCANWVRSCARQILIAFAI